MTDAPVALVVDDEPDVLLALRVGLEAEGFVTVLAADGETALVRIDDAAPDVVLLDVMMPVLDGWGVLEALARRSRRPPVIVVSARAADADVARAYGLGASGYVTKPFDLDRLVATIRDVLARSAGSSRCAHDAHHGSHPPWPVPHISPCAPSAGVPE